MVAAAAEMTMEQLVASFAFVRWSDYLTVPSVLEIPGMRATFEHGRVGQATPTTALHLYHAVHDKYPAIADQREVIDAFLAASRQGNFGALLALLDPDVIFRADETALHLGAPMEADGAEAVARAASGRAWGAEPGLVDEAVGLIWAPGGRPKVAFFFAITEGRIAAINMIADPEHVAELDLQPVDAARLA